MSQMARIKIEKLMKGKKLPFDDDCLGYLLSTAAVAEQKELIELLEEFCPKWAVHERTALAIQLKNSRQHAPEGSASFPSMPVPSTSSRAPEPFSAGQYGQPDVPDDQLAADALLAAMLQEEEDAQATLNNPGGQTGTAKKGKKAFKPLNISYTVARGGNAGPALGTAAPSSLADVLRQKRSQQVLDTGPPMGPGPPGPGDAPPSRPGPWGGAGLSWAERVQMNQGELETGDAPPPMAGTRALHPLKLRLRWAQAEHHLEAQPQDTVGDVKKRLEKMHGIAFSLQRLMHQGRELRDHEALQPMADRQHQIYLSLHQREAARPARSLQIKLQMPGSSVPSAMTVPERITGAGLKEQIQSDHGIRSDHLNLTFFGHPLRDDLSISDQGVAAGGCISVSIVSAAQRRQAERTERAATLAGMQTSAQGRVLDESEAVEAAIQASHATEAVVTGPSVELDEDHLGFEDLTEGDEEAVGDFNKDVAAQEPRFSGVVNQAKAIASHYRMEDYVSRVSKRSGYRLTLLMQKTKKDKVIGFLVFRFRGRSLCVLQLAVAKDARGRGAGRSLLRWAAREAQRATMENVLISTWPFGSELFLKLGFAETTAMEGEDVNGQVWAIQVARPPLRPRRAENSQRDETKLSRKDLIRSVFQSLNRSGSGCLTFTEMKPFAEHTGFDGSDAEWQKEFEELKQECRVNEIGLKEFDHLVNDQSDAGCYCSDDELRDLLRSLPPLPPPSAATVPGVTPSPAEGSRQQLIDAVFRALNRSASGQLSAAEMRPFAEKTGFSGSNEEWQEEFSLLARECGGVVDFSSFQRLVNDESDAGCYSSDSDLRALLNSFSAPGANQATPNPAPKAASQPKTSRRELIAACFRGLNVSGSGYLSAAEMKPFGQHTGFGGTDQEWQAEFAILKKECKVSAIALKDFHRLVNDQSDAGCYCSDAELQVLLESLPSAEPTGGVDLGPAITKAKAQALAPPTTPTAPSQPPTAPSGPSGPSARESLIFRAFQALNRSGSGHLSAAEMRPFAEITGFQGSDELWRKEFELLRQECQSRQIDFRQFQRLVNDSSENGCYCNDDDLRLVVEKQNLPNGRDGSAMPPAQVQPNGHQSHDPPGGNERAALIKSVFDALNSSGSSYLSAPEMRPLAELTGFTGTDQEWREEFDLLRQECDGSKPGISFTDFKRLVNDTSEDGCYCEDAHLRQLLKSRQFSESSAAETAVTAEAGRHQGLEAADLGRRALISSAFRALNRSGTGHLSASEMRPFAELTGFSGTDEEWQEEFELVRKECAASPGVPGIPFMDFQRLVNDESEDGCYASDDTLRELPNLIESRQSHLPNLIESKQSEFSPGTQQEAATSATAKPRGDSGRAALVESAFRFLNRSGSGDLSAVEMRSFAELTGFTGTDWEWQEEFELLRQECPDSRITLSTFMRLVNDKSDNGCYASDEDLRKLVSSSRSPPERGSRRALLSTVFAALNRSGSGQLSAQELRPLADRTGFQGSESEWHEEFNLLRQDCSRGEIRWTDFERLVNDQSDNGCYATDQELRDLLDFLNRNSTPPGAVPVFRPPPGLHPP